MPTLHRLLPDGDARPVIAMVGPTAICQIQPGERVEIAWEPFTAFQIVNEHGEYRLIPMRGLPYFSVRRGEIHAFMSRGVAEDHPVVIRYDEEHDEVFVSVPSDRPPRTS